MGNPHGGDGRWKHRQEWDERADERERGHMIALKLRAKRSRAQAASSAQPSNETRLDLP